MTHFESESVMSDVCLGVAITGIYTLVGMGLGGYVKGRSMRNAPNLNSADNTAIRAEIGERLRALLSKEQPVASPRVQHLLDCLSALDDR
jgi:hypothetical protein